ncbi:MAG: hypothetical protein ABI548_22150 [Polyangiaceae bacterium]
MEYRQVDGVDIYDFPTELVEHPLLAWMGDDYVQYVIKKLLGKFQQQDAGTVMLAIKCEQKPDLQTSLKEAAGTVTHVVLTLFLQILLETANGARWRLKGIGVFTPTSVSFALNSSERV